jgi:DivIVA domain-containing protein
MADDEDHGETAKRDRAALVSRLEKGVFGSSGGTPRRFSTARRGYDPAEVDAHIAELHETIRRQTERADTAERECAELRAHPEQAASAEPEAAALTSAGVGARIEKLLQLAEEEAAAEKNAGAQEADQTRQKARADAENYRHEAEEDRIARANALDAEAAERERALDARDAELSEKLEAAKAEADRIRAAAERAAKASTEDTETQARGILAEANQAAAAIRAEAVTETERLAGVRGSIYANLAEVRRVLASELDEDREDLDRHAHPEGRAEADTVAGEAAGGETDVSVDDEGSSSGTG